MTIISTTVDKNPLDKSSLQSQQKSPKCSSWVQFQKHRMISVLFQGKPFNIVVIQVSVQTTHAKEAEVK